MAKINPSRLRNHFTDTGWMFLAILVAALGAWVAAFISALLERAH